MPNVKLSPYILKADKLETQENKTLIVDKNSTNEQYPSAKAVYDALQNIEGSGSIEIDQTYNPESSNAQSGKAVAEALANASVGQITAPLDEKYIPDTIARTADIPEVPANVSQLNNDAGYITADDIPEIGESITVDDTLSDTSTNPVQNKVITAQLQSLLNIDYNELAFDTTEIVVNSINITSVLGQAILGQMVLA